MAKRATLRCSATHAVLLLGWLAVFASPAKADRTLVANTTTDSSSVVTVDALAKNSPRPQENAQPSVSKEVARVSGASESLESQAIKRNSSPSAIPANSPSVPLAKASPSKGQAVAALVAVLGLIALAAFFFRYFALRQRSLPGGKAIQIVARSGVGPKQSLCLVKWADRLLLVGLSPNHMATLDTVDDPEQIARLLGQMEKHRPDSISASFDKVFSRESREYGEEGQSLAEEADTPDAHGQWNRARQEVNSLLDKVKGLSRLRFRT